MVESITDSYLLVATIPQYRMTNRFTDGKEIKVYECLSKDTSEDVYKVRIVFSDGEEVIEEGDLQYYNDNYLMITVW